MIKSLALRNFQSHKDSTLFFDPGVNVIVGSTDSGKTAFIRALKLVIENRPSGDEFISNWADVMEIIMVTGEIDTITRVKGKKDNAYFLNEQEFVAFGTDVPQEITEALNIHEINLQYQLDSPFLLTSTPGEVAAHFNRIAGLDRIDLSVKAVNKWINEILQANKYREKSVESYQEQLTKFEHLDQFEADVEVAEGMEKKRIRLHNDITSLNGLITEINEIQALITEINEILEDEELINNAIAAHDTVQELENDIHQVSILIENAARTELEIERLDKIIGDEELVNKTITLGTEIKKKQDEWDALNEKIARGGALVISIAAHEDTRKRYQKKFDELFPDVCPLCNTPIKID